MKVSHFTTVVFAVGFIFTGCNQSTETAEPSVQEDNDYARTPCPNNQTRYWRDGDNDDFGKNYRRSFCASTNPDPTQFAPRGGDCDNQDPDAYPGAPEVCDGVDNDCNGLDDDFCVDDNDNDGFTVAELDCNDNDASIHPLAFDDCDGVDEDCDGDYDEDTLDPRRTWTIDEDNDGFGDEDGSPNIYSCGKPWDPSGNPYIDNTEDCSDTEAGLNPAELDVCDGIDNDCDGLVDDQCSQSTTCRVDNDDDNHGTSSTFTSSDSDCNDAGEAPNSGSLDCNDNNAAIHVGATEVTNGVDDDCDGSIDEGGTSSTWYRDQDGDGYGNSGSTTVQSSQPAGYVGNSTDCDDGDSDTFPGSAAFELSTSCTNDDDNDGFGDKSVSSMYVEGTDCNDGNAAVKPGATEVTNGVDDDCDGNVDEGTSSNSVQICVTGYNAAVDAEIYVRMSSDTVGTYWTNNNNWSTQRSALNELLTATGTTERCATWTDSRLVSGANFVLNGYDWGNGRWVTQNGSSPFSTVTVKVDGQTGKCTQSGGDYLCTK